MCSSFCHRVIDFFPRACVSCRIFEGKFHTLPPGTIAKIHKRCEGAVEITREGDVLTIPAIGGNNQNKNKDDISLVWFGKRV